MMLRILEVGADSLLGWTSKDSLSITPPGVNRMLLSTEADQYSRGINELSLHRYGVL
jgi:hypothetical protein